jgi:pimeloyl-ACP methyl ester carboxylesterase
VLWVGAEDSFVRKWLAGGKNASESDAEATLKSRMAVFSNVKLITVADAGHMLHHDQPAVVAGAIEAFLAT